jgi:hypothetical protein
MDKESGRATSFDVVKREVVEVIDAIKEKLTVRPRLSRKSQQILERIRRQQGISPDGRILSGQDDEEPLWVGDPDHTPPPHGDVYKS